jgi:hypothetical protein
MARKQRPASRFRPALQALEDRVVPSTDFLYVGDGISNTVQRFDAATGAALGTFVDGSKSLDGPRGMVFDGDGHLLLANQNVNRGKPGEIMKYDAATGAFLCELVPFQDANAPFAPRAMVLKDNILYVASMQTGATTKSRTPSGEIDEYNATTGAFLRRTTPPATLIQGLADQQFNPRGIVFGPDGNLYVSVIDPLNLNAGYVMQLNETTHPGAWSIVAFNNGDAVADPGETADLHRPEGLVFGPGPTNNLYVNSFRAGASDTDKIVIFNAGGVEVDNIPLDAVGQPRAFGQALLFGPGGRLFVPITGFAPNTGAVRSYDVATKTFTNLVGPGTMGQPWYLTFGNTDAATLAYKSGPSNSVALNPVVAAAAQPLATPVANALPSTPPGGAQAGSVSSSGSTAVSLPAMPNSVTRAAGSASPIGALDLLFAMWAEMWVDEVLTGSL